MKTSFNLFSFQKARRNHIGFAVIVAILIFDTMVYKYQGEDFSNGTEPICFPLGKIQDSLKLDDQNATIARFRNKSISAVERSAVK